MIKLRDRIVLALCLAVGAVALATAGCGNLQEPPNGTELILGVAIAR